MPCICGTLGLTRWTMHFVCNYNVMKDLQMWDCNCNWNQTSKQFCSNLGAVCNFRGGMVLASYNKSAAFERPAAKNPITFASQRLWIYKVIRSASQLQAVHDCNQTCNELQLWPATPWISRNEAAQITPIGPKGRKHCLQGMPQHPHVTLESISIGFLRKSSVMV